ncbi:hypothetical protein [Thiothrix fructosivorans]|uniref:Uncharacterized protein n=2 Tax=Thiothrix fructosivorans TaxID=111770 RepID=A0A8B0SJX7_9GAMM|nr:hypothetical protein [Thiothrix fructosivorans]QTX11159.1 hypothetical protein J1836_001965 [Thiothrix fructosivorans]
MLALSDGSMIIFPDLKKIIITRIAFTGAMVVIYNSGSIVALIIIIIMFLVGELTSTRSISIDNGTLNIAYYFHNETIKISEIKYMRKINLMENSKYKTRIIFKNNAIKDFIRPFLFSKKDINYLINEINKP